MNGKTRYLCSVEIDIDAESPQHAAQAMWRWLRRSSGPSVTVQALDGDRRPVGEPTMVDLSEVLSS